jgi:hypothetical protein
VSCKRQELLSFREHMGSSLCLVGTVFGFGLNHTSESSVRAKYTIYLPSFLAAIHYYVDFPLVDIIFITKEPLLIPKVSRSGYLSGKVPLWIYTVINVNGNSIYLFVENNTQSSIP